ncbi:ImcF-related family protein [Serratia microhaemolytica]|uniref:ImcF-related family protein n=1 Tax=Serratia microhaemolytica TaxID=2675110 RepID=UPI000FDDE766|nr:ImcF-related family protein [Serratia microhaemolytica]
MKQVSSALKRPEVWFWLITLLLLLISTLLSWLLWQHPEQLSLDPQGSTRTLWLTVTLVSSVLLLLFATLAFIGSRLAGKTHFEQLRQQLQADDQPAAVNVEHDSQRWHNSMLELKQTLRRRYGRLWRRQVRLLMVVGEAKQIAALVPSLAEQGYLYGENSVLLHGGSLSQALDASRLASWRQLSRRKPLDGIVWVLDQKQRATLDHHLATLEHIGQLLHYRPALYLWQVCSARWQKNQQDMPAIGALLAPSATVTQLEQQLTALLPQLRAQGLQQLQQHPNRDFMLRLAERLQTEEINQWRQALNHWLTLYRHQLPLRGLLFSLPISTDSSGRIDNANKLWSAPACWQSVLDDCQSAHGQPIGLAGQTLIRHTCSAVLLLATLGSLLSFGVNRQQIISATEQVAQFNQPQQSGDQQLIALQSLSHTISQLQRYRAKGTPWYRRFGLDYTPQLLTQLLQHYQRLNQPLLSQPAARQLAQKLTALLAVARSDPNYSTLLHQGYPQLKAYLMITSQPEKAEASFFAALMQQIEPERAGINPELWRSLAPELWRFYANTLRQQPDWQLNADNALIARTRHRLLSELGQSQTEQQLYQHIISTLQPNYSALMLADMTAGTDAELLFHNSSSVPGLFSRSAWEQHVQPAIAAAVANRQQQLDWVLGEQSSADNARYSASTLRTQLTQRYFADFSRHWQAFLNNMQWQPARSLPDVIEQLTLISDLRRSPLVALLNHLSWQADTEQQPLASASQRLKKIFSDAEAEDEQPRHPLHAEFAAIQVVTGKASAETALLYDSALNLQSYLTRVTRLRLKLQQVLESDDPHVLAQTVFQGKNLELLETQQYAQLLAASFGTAWQRFSQTLFLQPVTQSWEALLQPAILSLNQQWQTTVVSEWQAAFNGRYPFVDSKNDASLALLQDFIAKDHGRIEAFLSSELAGMLYKQGNRWVIDSVNSRGLHFNPEFLSAINQLSQIANILRSTERQYLQFELLARPVANVLESNLLIDGKELHYFNQMENWQKFRWPSDDYHPGVTLTWNSAVAGSQLYGDYPGSWGLIRWLEQGRQQKLRDGHYQLSFTVANQPPLQWILRTEQGNGPLALLALRNFNLPAQIFLSTKPANRR